MKNSISSRQHKGQIRPGSFIAAERERALSQGDREIVNAALSGERRVMIPNEIPNPQLEGREAIIAAVTTVPDHDGGDRRLTTTSHPSWHFD